jgi:hypothetical protein
MRDRLSSDSNLTVERFPQSEKDPKPTVSREEGIQIEESDEQPEKANESIRESREPDSNVTSERLAQ